MDNWNRSRKKQPESLPEAATDVGLKPGDFPVGSLESRAAARRVLQRRKDTPQLIVDSGFPIPAWAQEEGMDIEDIKEGKIIIPL